MLRQLVLFLSLFITSCATAPPTQPGGDYYGHLPCADCPGISYQLTLYDNYTFEARYRHHHQADLIINRGTYSIADDGNILLIGKTGPINNRIAIGKDTLWLLDENGDRFKGGSKYEHTLSKVRPINYKLSKKSAAQMSAFEAHGNEPSWELKSNLSNSMSFKTLDQHALNLSLNLPESDKTNTEQGTIYTGSTDSLTVIATVRSATCFDNMSGNEFTHMVEVQLISKNAVIKNYSGCGSYSGNYRINDIWVLTHIDGEPITRDNGEGESPYIEFNISSGSLMGFAGCNRFGGNFEFGENTITVSQLFSTEMACDNPGPEDLFLQVLNQQSLKYDISSLQLKLTGKSYSATFKKVD